MVHKKRTHAPRPKHSAVHENAAIPLLESDQSLVSVQKSKKDATAVVGGEKNVVSPSLASIKLECERALTALRRGNHTKALRLIKELCSKHESSPHAALIHRVQGSVYVKVALLIDDPNTKRRHFNNAIESARRAVSLCPNSIEFAQFYANLLYEAANEAKEYEEVVQECERALAIENPIDPAKQSLLEESQQKDETPRARIDHVRSDLRSLIQKSNIATISTWVKNIGSGEETIRLIPIRRRPEDPMDQARRSNQIKKANKTPEERRKEIEVRVAAARLLQQKSETVKMHNDGEKALDLTEESMQRIGERRKSGNARKNPSATERRDRVQSYWNSLTLVRKKELLRIAISDLKAHFSASKDRLAIEVLSEALSFAETSKDWMFWTCCRCNKKFIDSVSHNYHAEHEHIGTLRPKLQSVLPQTVENEWVEMLLNCSWEPLDVSATVDMLDKLSGSQRQGPRDEKHSGYNTEECFLDEKHPRDNTDERYPRDNTDECFVDEKHPRGTEECFLDEKHPRDNTEKCFVDEKHPGDTEECFLDEKHPRDNTEESKYGCSEVFCSEDNGDSTPRKKKFGDIPNPDMVESRLCDKISDIELMDCDENYDTKNCFLPDKWPLSDDPHRAKLLEKISSVFQKLIKSKCLASSQLSKVVHFAAEELQGLAFGSQLSSFNVDQIPLCICFLGAEQLKEVLKFLQELLHCCGLGRYSEKISARDGASNSSQGFDDLEKLVFSEDGSCLLFDQRFLPCRFTRSSCPDIVSIDRTAHVLSSNQNQNGAELDPEALLSWIFEGPSSAEQLVSWTCAREEKAQRGIEILRFLEKELNDLQCLCERKYEHLSYEEALQVVEDIFLEEGKRRDQATEFVLQSYDSVLRKRREELIESDNDVTIFGYRSELNAISNVLKEAESLNVNRFGLEESNSGGTSQLGDIESGEEDEWKLKDYIHQVDSCVEVALQRQKECVSIELCKIDARIMGVVARMQQLKVKLGHACAQDYRSILVTLLKSYMRTHLEDLATKDATEKSDAASEAFLAELARDSKNSSGGGNGCSKHTHEKVKDKKKNREYRKTKGSKPTSGNELHLLRYQTMEDISFAVTCDGENQGDETVGNGDSFNEQDKEYRRRIELESEERKLEETLEFQRRMENEAKLKHLAEQTKRTAKTCPQSVDAVMKSDTCSKYRDNGQLINGQLKSSKRKEFPDSLGSLPKISTEEMSQRTEDSTLVSTQYTGRRGRRQNDSKLIDGNFQSASEEKENTEVGEPIALRSSHGVNGPADSGTKTLKQLHVENHDEERFQADLKKAVQQSLDTFHAHKKLPLLPSSGNGQRVFPKAGTLGNANSIGDVNKVDVYGTGLKNEVGEYNCFLNVIIQSLWHLGRFRDEFLRTSSEHVHVGDPCVTCALYDIFTALNTASTEACSKTVAPTSLRIALSNLYPDSSFFQEGQMNDASEVLGVIFDCLHQSFTSASGVSDTESADSSCMGTWDCSNGACIVHSLFGMDIFEQMNCYNCGLESRHLKYTSFFHNINASALRTMKACSSRQLYDDTLIIVMSPESSFDALLNLVEMNYQLSCYSEVDECRKLNCIHHILSTPPHVFTTVLGWQNTCESVGDITATLSALSTEVDISVLYHGLAPKNKHCLISMVCYYGQHYHCFAYSCDHGKWVMYDDKTVKVIGDWDDVLVTCERGHLQPQVLFFEAVK
ncbi:putative LOB domain-containing protein 27-like [Capsicum annuum]|nr:putative LOB domain-containing protein 27-like [Capsicum annuum]